MNEDEAKKLQEKFDGSTYSLPTKILPKEFRRKILILYKFVRIFDEYIDEENTPNKEKFFKAKEEFIKALSSGSGIDFINDMAILAKEEKIEDQIFIFLDAMELDITKSRYQNYKELEDYMSGSATAVGYIFLKMCNGDERLKPEAKSLAEFFQMVNFLRDIREDIDNRDRIYIPKEDLIKFNLKDEDIINKNFTDDFIKMMRFQEDRCLKLYEHGFSGIKQLPRNVRLGVYASNFAYKKYLDKIRILNYNVFSYKKLKLNKIEKIETFIKAFIYTYIYE
jgi:phytoene synthase